MAPYLGFVGWLTTVVGVLLILNAPIRHEASRLHRQVAAPLMFGGIAIEVVYALRMALGG